MNSDRARSVAIGTVKGLLRRYGYELKRAADLASEPDQRGEFPVDFGQEIIETVRTVAPYTMTSPERIFALCDAVRYVVAANVPGDIVECGVGRGGSIMAVARTLIRIGDLTRICHLYDTFEGMTQPTEVDVDFAGVSALDQWKENRFGRWNSPARAAIDEVCEAVWSTGYDKNKFRFVKGRVEDTLPAQAPDTISLLRLDTDWYESTRHELVHLYPRLSRGGVLIIDDYGHYAGARKGSRRVPDRE